MSNIEAASHATLPDYDTALIGQITGSIIDADRLVRMEWRNGFPNWDLYRVALAGDAAQLPRLRRWAVAFSVAYCVTGGVKRSVYSDELAAVAAWDALSMLVFCRPLQPYTQTAQDLGVSHRTYRRLRDTLYLRMRASLYEYWARLGMAFRAVCVLEKKAERKYA